MNRAISTLMMLLLVLIVACAPSEDPQPSELQEGNESSSVSASSEDPQPSELQEGNESSSVSASSEDPQPSELQEGNESSSVSASSEDPQPSELPEEIQIFENNPSDTVELVEVEMTARQWEFIPDTITVKKGQTVNLRVTSVDVAHGIAIPDFGVNAYLKPGSEVEMSFVADKFGTFDFVCSIECGRGHNRMRGVVIVE